MPNPYHDRRGRFTTGGNRGAGPSPTKAANQPASDSELQAQGRGHRGAYPLHPAPTPGYSCKAPSAHQPAQKKPASNAKPNNNSKPHTANPPRSKKKTIAKPKPAPPPAKNRPAGPRPNRPAPTPPAVAGNADAPPARRRLRRNTTPTHPHQTHNTPQNRTPKPTPAPTPPGPIRLELRINGKIALTQRLYAYTIDQGDDTLTITGNLRPTHDEPR